jgi:hypothetical protein
MTEFVNMPIPVEKFTAVCALLGGVSLSNIVDFHTQKVPETYSAVVTAPVEAVSEAKAIEQTLLAAESEDIEIETDANGVPFDTALHTGTKKKDGTWRMKKGAETPSSTSTASPANGTAAGVTEPAGSSPIEEPASAVASQEEDEFAAFREAAAKVDAAATPVVVPEREWTDSDLGALCNQAAVKLGDPSPVKEQIAKFVPEGEVAHSRNVPADKRAEFVKAIEAAAGIEFAG